MKNTFLFALYIVIWGPLLAQTQNGLHYQGVARNAQGAPLAGATIAIRLSIKDAASNGNTLYSETKSIMTNAFGLYSISINDGAGIRTGDFEAINWSAGARFLQTEIDPANGTAFMDMGTQQMQSVSHSLSAKSLDGVENPQNGDLLEYKNGSWLNKPKTKRYHIAGGLGFNPSFTLNFIGVKTSIAIEKDNPVITINLTKAIGSSLGGGASALTVNLGYQKAGGLITEFDLPDQNNVGRITNLRVPSGTRIPLFLSGTYQTNFKAGEIYDIGIVGFSSDAIQWNDNGFCKGYIEVSY
jgi:hypothetical protein